MAPPPEPPDTEEEEAAAALHDHPLRRFLGPRSTYFFTRFAVLRLLGLVYFFAFFSAARQLVPLIGHHGLLPADVLVASKVALHDSRLEAFWQLPSIFVFTSASDAAISAVCWTGALLSLAVLGGVTNALVQLALWGLYLSIVLIGQQFYGYGWESQILETGFLAVFLCPIRTLRPFPGSAPSPVVVWLFRWLIVRIMLGAGLIKLRGDPCWRDLTCLVYHFETQPLPSPLSPLFHALPRAILKGGVLLNHAAELCAPFFAFGPRRARHVAGLLIVGFQIVLIVSGNLSFVNWLTLVPALACFDDSALARLFPAGLRARVLALAGATEPTRVTRRVSYALAAVILVRSVEPVLNLLSPHQAMNLSYDRLHLVNTYGFFGGVTRERFEVVLEGTDAETLDDHTVWRPYDLPCEPGDVHRRPCFAAPYHYRLDWQMWFAGFTPPNAQPWLPRLVYQLLRGDPGVKRLFAGDPFPDRPPRWIRAMKYRYRFAKEGGTWWERTLMGPYLRPLSLEDPVLRRIVESAGWERDQAR